MGRTHRVKRQQRQAGNQGNRPPPHGGYHHKVRVAKQRIILTALMAAGGSFADAARALKINRTYLHRLVNELDLREMAVHLVAPSSGALSGAIINTGPRWPIP